MSAFCSERGRAGVRGVRRWSALRRSVRAAERVQERAGAQSGHRLRHRAGAASASGTAAVGAGEADIAKKNLSCPPRLATAARTVYSHRPRVHPNRRLPTSPGCLSAPAAAPRAEARPAPCWSHSAPSPSLKTDPSAPLTPSTLAHDGVGASNLSPSSGNAYLHECSQIAPHTLGPPTASPPSAAAASRSRAKAQASHPATKPARSSRARAGGGTGRPKAEGGACT